MTILVSGASGIVGYGIAKSLIGRNLIGITIYGISVAPVFCDNVEIVLPINHPDYMDNLCEIIYDYHVDMIIPGIECDMFRWNQGRELLSSMTFPLLNNSELIDLCFDKWLFYEKLIAKHPQYAIPTTLDAFIFPLPYLLKPRNGYGSKGIIKIKRINDLHQNIEPNMMVQPIIGSDEEEYTVSGFFDYDSNLIDYFPLRRKLMNGSTGEAAVEDRNFMEILIELAETFKPVGPTNFQFRFDGDQPKLLEINPRISSATSIRTAFGYNEARMSVDYFLNGKLPPREKRFIFKENLGRKAIRYMEDYIF